MLPRRQRAGNLHDAVIRHGHGEKKQLEDRSVDHERELISHLGTRSPANDRRVGHYDYEERHREQQVQLLKKRAAKLGFQIVERDAA